MDQIINIDANALLRTLKELEARLSEQYRQDLIPVWASSIFPRLEILESMVSRGQITHEDYKQHGKKVNLEDLAGEERIYERVRSEIESQAGATRLTIESKVSSLSLELDRIHKLLQIRPTTSELQKVMLAVHENELKIQRVVADMSSSVKTIAQEKITEGMSSILENLRQTESINEQGVKNLMRKVDSFANDVSNLKLGVENSLGAVNTQVSKMKELSVQTSEDIQQLRAEVEASNKRLQLSIAEEHAAQKLLADELAEHRLYTQEKINSIQLKLDDNEAGLYQILRSAEEREISVRANLNDLRTALDEFKAMYHLDVDDVKATVSMINDSLTSVRSRQEDIERYVRALKDVDVLNKVPMMEDRIIHEEKRMAVVEKELKALVASSNKTGKSILEINGMLADLPGRIDGAAVRIEELEKDLKDSKEFTKRLQASLKETQTQVDEFATLRDEVAVVREITNNHEQLVKSQQTSIDALLEATDDQDKRTIEIEKAMKFNDDKAQRRMDEMRKEIMVAMVDKQEAMEIKLQVVRDSIDVIATSGDNSSKHGGSASMGGGVVSGGELNVVVISKEDQKAITFDRALFVAELCMNYEDISVRKTALPDLPETICEHLAATAQAFSSFAAQCADGEAIQTMLRGRPDNISYADAISERRQKLLQDFVSIVSSKVEANNPQPGQIRAEARDKFIRQLRRALDVAMSKHDQVSSNGPCRMRSFLISFGAPT